MKKILLVCSAGMSTSLLVSKMKIAAKKKQINCVINAIGETELDDYSKNFDVVLLGPQVQFLFAKLKERFNENKIPVGLISSVDFSTMNGDKVLKSALNLIENR